MRVILFQPRFAKLVGEGAKHQTIRRKAGCQPGDTLSLRQWTGLPYRSKQQVIATVTCQTVEPFEMCHVHGETLFTVCGHVLAPEQMNEFASRDGFTSALEMIRWFEDTHGLPFHGCIIRW